MAATLVLASNSNVRLIGAAQPCNVYWQVGSSATLGTNSTFTGNILALTSIQVQTNVTVEGRALARNASVTLDADTITAATCSTSSPTPCTGSGSRSSLTQWKGQGLRVAEARRRVAGDLVQGLRGTGHARSPQSHIHRHLDPPPGLGRALVTCSAKRRGIASTPWAISVRPGVTPE